MVHNSDVFGIDASPSDEIKIMTPKLLKNFKNAVKQFVECMISRGENLDISKIEDYLNYFGLCGNKIIDRYTTKYKQKSK